MFIDALIATSQLDVRVAEHCVSQVADMMWNKRHYFEQKIDPKNEFDSLKAEHIAKFIAKCAELYGALRLPSSSRD